MRAIHQFLPSYAERDAIGAHVREVQRMLHARGVVSEIFTENLPARDLRASVRSFRDFGTSASDENAVLMYHASIGSAISDWLLQRPETVIVNYHNVTPMEFFAPWEPGIAAELRAGRAQAADLGAVTELGIADSPFNASELDAWGYRESTVVPILLDFATFDHKADPATVDALESARRKGGAHWLFVGRLSPNKCQHNLVKAFAYYQRAFDPNAHLTMVGASSSGAYETALREFVDALGLSDAVTFAQSVSAEVLAAYYEHADVFVCVSEHEGFCVPLLEAMYHGLPIVALGAAAVPATLGAGGLITTTSAPSIIAEAAHRVVSDDVVRTALTAAGHARVQDYSLDAARQLMLDALLPIADGGA